MSAEVQPQVVRRPLLAASTAFCLGALFEPSALTAPAVSLGVLAVLTVAAARRRRILAALMLPSVFFCAGLVVGGARLPPAETLTAQRALDGAPLLVEGLVAEAPDWRGDGHRLVVDLTGTSTTPRAELAPAVGRVWLTVTGTAAPCGDPGDRIRAWARVRPYVDPMFDGGQGRRARAARRGVSLRGFVARPQFCVRVGKGPPRPIEHLRARVQAAIRRALPGPEGGLVRALAIGDRSGLTDATRAAFARAGLSHVLAVSGLHLAVTCGLLVLLLQLVFTRIERIALGPGAARAAALCVLPLVPLYTLFVGAAPSAVRAALMVGALLVAHAFSRLREAWSALALAVIVMVAWDPATLSDPGFQLSFAAVAALLRIQPALADKLAPNRARWPKVLRAPFEAGLASVAATIGTLPLALRHFGLLPVAGLVANLPAAPLAALVVVPLSLLGGLLSVFAPSLGAPVLALAGLSAQGLDAIAHAAASLPGAAVHLPQPTILECTLFYGATIGFSLPARRKGARALGVFSTAFLALSLFVGVLAPKYAEDLTVTFLPVGQGNAALVELPGGTRILVDTGPGGPGADAATRVLIPFLRKKRIGALDAVVLTHPHADHTGSLETLAEAVPIGEVWWTGDVREGPEALGAWVQRIGARRVDARTTKMQFGAATVEFLGPVRAPDAYPDVNDGSVALSVALGARKVLIVGDAEAPSEQDMLQKCAACLKADVLLAGHHGSRSSTTQAFLQAVSPEHVVFSVGLHNRFRFPHPTVVERVRTFGAKGWRTDLDGAVTVHTDGVGLDVEGFRSGGEVVSAE